MISTSITAEYEGDLGLHAWAPKALVVVTIKGQTIRYVPEVIVVDTPRPKWAVGQVVKMTTHNCYGIVVRIDQKNMTLKYARGEGLFGLHNQFDIVIDPTWNRIRGWRERLRDRRQ